MHDGSEPTERDVAADKGAALAAARTAVLGPGVDSAIIEHLRAPAARRAQSMVSLATTDNPSRIRLGWGDHPPTTITSPLSGRHQIDNLHLAVALGGCRRGTPLARRAQSGRRTGRVQQGSMARSLLSGNGPGSIRAP